MKYQERCDTEMLRGPTDQMYEAIKLGTPDNHDPESKLRLEVAIFEAKKSFEKLIAKLRTRGLMIAATYVGNATEKLLMFLTYWIQLERKWSSKDQSGITQNHRRQGAFG